MTKTKKRYRLSLERLEQRQLLTAVAWFADSGQQLGTNADGAEFGDLDGDGDLDVFVGCRNWPGGPSCRETQVWLNNGSGQFSKGWSGAEKNIGGLALGDLDHDGDLDAFLTGASPFGSRNSEVWLNDGQGNFEDSGQRLNDIAFNVVLADVDSDGDLDAVTAHPEDASKVWLNNGTGQFTDSGQRLAPAQWTLNIATGDVDGDGDLDAYFARAVASPTDLLYLNDGQGKFSDSGQTLDPSLTNALRLGDLDGDGDLDAFVANGNVETSTGGQPNRVYLNDGTGKFTDSGQRLGTAISNSVELADLDGDGDLDALVANGVRHWGNVVDQANEIWWNDGTGVFTVGQEIGNAASYRVALGDIDSDGDLDAFFGNIGQDNQVWLNTQPIAGDANRDAVFNRLDIVQILQSAKYQTGQPATWAEGDFNGDRVFDQLDIVEALQTGTYGQASPQSFAAHPGAENEVPFKGSVQAVETSDVQFPTLFVDSSGSGNATHLGRFTVTHEFEVDLPTLIATGSAQFIEANGDSIFTVTEALDPPQSPEPDVLFIVETHTITGGTGRFDGATGSFKVERLLNTVTGVSSGSFDGTIVFHKAK